MMAELSGDCEADATRLSPDLSGSCEADATQMSPDLSGSCEVEATRLLKWVRSRRMQSVDNVDQFEWLHGIAYEMRMGVLKVRSAKETIYKEILDCFGAKNLDQFR